MKSIAFILRWLGLSLSMMLLWMLSNLIAEFLLGYRLPGADTSASMALGLFFTVCLLHSWVLILIVRHSSAPGRWTWITLLVLVWGIQFVMPQSETLWFNAAVSMPVRAVIVLLLSGLLLATMFSVLAIRVIPRKEDQYHKLRIENHRAFWGRWAVLCILVYPILYFTAGYFIAWQSEEVRQFYTGSAHLAPFLSTMTDNILSGLYLFQVIRAILWVGLAWLAMRIMHGPLWKQALLVGLLFAVLMNAQLLLPNPYMPASVRWVHLIETTLSNFVWGCLIVYILRPATNPEVSAEQYRKLPPKIKAA